jgi:RimJ/RimL family protein N-acetyltransferase
MAVELETERLRLRQWRESDVEPLLTIYGDPVSQQLWGSDIKLHDEWRRIAVFLGHWQLKGFGLWALEEKSTARFAGYAGLWFPLEFTDVEVGYGLVPQCRGKGYATEAAARARAYAYDVLKLPTVVSYIHPINEPSKRVAERLGATPDGEFMLQGRPHIVYRHPNTVH